MPTLIASLLRKAALLVLMLLALGPQLVEQSVDPTALTLAKSCEVPLTFATVFPLWKLSLEIKTISSKGIP